MNLKQITLASLLLFASLGLKAQLANGSTAPNVTFSDLNGNTHELYDILDQGKSVIMDVMATWCGPCWNYHNSDVLKTIYNTYGPGGAGEVEVFMIEASPSTTQPCLNGPAGCTGGTIGDWVTGTPYPIVHIQSDNAPTFSGDYSIPGYPTLYKICPNRKIYRINVTGTQIWIDWINSCSLQGEGTVSNSICYNDGLGEVDLEVTGGLGNKTYIWDNGATTQDLNNVSPGSYSCTITEGQGHTIEVGPFMVEGSTSALNVSLQQATDVSCFGQNNGMAITNTSGGTAGYNYNWNNGSQSPNLMNVPGGTYMLTVTDNLGCEETLPVQIFEPTPLTLDGISNNENCGQMDGTVSLFGGGGTGTYLYDIGTGQQFDNVFLNLSAGTYVATVTDENACTEQYPVVVQEVAGPTAEAGADALVDCANPSVQLDGNGSTTGSNILINWTTTDGNIQSGGNTLQPIVDLPGTYTISIINTVSGCESTDVVSVSGDNAVPNSDAGADGTIDCNNATYLLDGGSSSSGSQYSYEWKDASGNVVGSQVTYEASLAGVYELVVTNANNGCTATSMAMINENTIDPDVNAGSNQTINCINANITLLGTTSINNPSFEWKNSSGDVIGTDASIVVNDADNYTLNITDGDNGCSAQDAVTVDMNTNVPTSDAGADTALDCNTAQVVLGGNSSTGNTISYSWLDENNQEVGTSENLTVTDAGDYTLIVTDSDNGCSESSMVNVNLDTQEPLTSAGPDGTITCDNSAVLLDGNGSATGSQYQYEWLNDNGVVVGENIEFTTNEEGIFTLRITNTANGCVATDQAEVFENTELPMASAGADGQIDCINSTIELSGMGSSTGADFSYVWRNGSGNVIGNDITVEVSSAGSYSLEVINDVNGCSLVDMANVTASTDFPMVATQADGDLTCVRNTVNLSGSGSSSGSGFSYQWVDENGNQIGTNINVDVTETGTYTLIVNDNNNGCVASEDVIVNSNTTLPESIIETPDALDCNTNFVLLDGITSTGNNLAYTWKDAMNQEIGTDATVIVQNAGSYSLVVMDGENGCVSETAQVSVIELPPVQMAIMANDDVLCFGENNGSVTLETTGGFGDYNYTWPNGSSNASQSNLSAGTYLVSVTDDNGCSDQITIVVNQPDAITINVSSTNETGDNQNDGTASVEVEGGTGNFMFEWSNDSSGSSIDQLSPGVYSVTATDENGCSIEEIVNISSFDCVLEVATTFQNVSCFGENDGGISLEIPQGVANVYNWSSGQSSPNLTGLAPGVYSYTVTDFNSCDVLGQVEIIEPAQMTSEITNVQNITCGSGQSGMATVVVSGGTGMYTYVWSNGESTSSASQLSAGDHTFLVTDENGCSNQLNVTIEADDMIDPVAVAQNVDVNINANGIATISVAEINSGSSDNCGIANLSLSQTSFDCSQLGEQEVILTVVDLSGNTNAAIAIVNIKDEISPEIDCQENIFTNSCAPIVYDMPTATDNCSVEIELIEGMPSGSVFPVGTHVITHRAVDPSGNMTMCSFEITVVSDLESSTVAEDALCFDDATGIATVMVNGGTPGYQYLWDDGQETATASGLAIGDYSVLVTDNTGCTTEQTVTINQPAELLFDVDELINDTNGQGVGAISITAMGGIPGYGYTWTKDGVFYSNEEDLTGLGVGNYGVEIIDQNGCIEQRFGLNIDNMVPTRDLELLNQIDLMPNPTSDFIIVNFELTEEKMVSLEVVDIHGRVIQNAEFGMLGFSKQRIDLSKVSSGVYFVRIKLDDKLVTKRLIVQH